MSPAPTPHSVSHSRYVALARSLSGVLEGCWLDVREMAPGDHVTVESARAIASARCLVIFFSYEVSMGRGYGESRWLHPLRPLLPPPSQYLRSVNCTLELMVALRHRGGAAQRTIVLLEGLNEPAMSKRRKGSPLTAAEARAVAAIITDALPGVIVARAVAGPGGLLDTLDRQCIRSLSAAGTSTTSEWWARHGRSRTDRVDGQIRVVPPLIEPELKQRWPPALFTWQRRRWGDVAAAFVLISGDGSKIERYERSGGGAAMESAS